LKHNIEKALGLFLFGIIALCQIIPLFAQSQSNNDSLKYPIQDRYGDRFTYKNRNTFSIGDTSILHQTIEYDAKTRQYFIVEKIGNSLYRKPTYLTFQEFYELQKKAQEAAYFKQRTDGLFALNKRLDRPKPIVYPSFFDRTFGLGNIAPNLANDVNNAVNTVKDKVQEGKDQLNNIKGKVEEGKNAVKKPKNLIDIQPTGNLDIFMGYQGNFTNNPTLPERARRTGGFDFDMNANVGINASIGDKLKLPINYNTQANFDFSNQIKLDYKGTQDQLLKSIEAGNIGFEARGTLIPSATNLFGVKTSLQFGKLTLTAAFANQRSQRQNQQLQGGGTVQQFQKKLSDYEENKHFLVAQHFRKNYNDAMSRLPIINSQINVQRIEVWVTNRNGATTDARDIIAFTDLSEGINEYLNPTSLANPNIAPTNNRTLPDNANNVLYSRLTANANNRIPSQVNSNMISLGLSPVRDYEKTFARKLTQNEYQFNPQLGTLSLNSPLMPDEVLGVAYEYSVNGRVYKVGEFSQEVALDTSSQRAGVQKMLFLKMLKATAAKVQLPIWRLMMKNVYSLDMVGITREDFRLNILYDQPSGGMNRYLPESNKASEGRPIISLVGLDRLNNRNDPQPDGQFDFVEGFTIVSQAGRVMLPKLEPFGADLDTIAFGGTPDSTRRKYVFKELYDSIKAIAQTFANVDRFVMQGQSKGTGGSEIYLNGYNIPPGSVRITAGGRILTEGADYTIDYNLGQVKILNSGLLSSGEALNVSYENNAAFGIQQRGFLGVRLDYKASKKFSFGGTLARLNERPFFTKMNIGDDPVRNTIYGVDFSYTNNIPKLTKWLDKLPFYSTKAMSTITAYGEAAYFKPGHPPQIGKGDQGLIYIDDFEGTRSSLDLRFPPQAWTLASTPQGTDYPEALLTDSVDYGFNRAKLSWYNIESNLQDRTSNTNPLRNNLNELSDPRVRQIFTNELFPQQTTNLTNTQTQTFDVTYYPKEPGPYNFNTTEINSDGFFTNPAQVRKKWGGIMRSIDQTDFETNNFEFIEFWMQDPFLYDSIVNGGAIRSGGKLKINLGNISEDVLKDGKRFYENGMPTPTSPSQVDSSTTWGRVPTNPIQITNAFSNDPNDRAFQDVGFDGLDDASERRKRANYLAVLEQKFGSNSTVFQQAQRDPSRDNYLWYRDINYDELNSGIIERYKGFNGPQGNSPIAGGGAFSPAATLQPDNEDLNRDNTLNETEQYYEYEIDLQKGLTQGSKYITDSRRVSVRYANGRAGQENWFLFRIPIREFAKNVNNITDFKSIRFMRMYLTDWDSAITLRFARLDLVRNMWRNFTFELDSTGRYNNISAATNPSNFNTLAVNLEENSNRTPVNYVIPPGIERVQQLSNNGVNLLLNEQALSMRFSNLAPKQSRAVFKTLNMDIRLYGKLRMFSHLDQPITSAFKKIQDDDVNLIVRIGQDFLSNYYEIRVPMKLTAPGRYTPAQANRVWPDSNNLDIDIAQLIAMKVRRNNVSSVERMYREVYGGKTISIFGNPNLGEVRGILVGVENTNGTAPIEGEAWINELRLSEINEVGAYAALGRVDVQLADLGKFSVSANMHTQGFGSIESKIGQRSRDNLSQFDAALTMDAGKLLPKQAKLSIPVYASISKTILKPQYDPYDKDVLYNDKIAAAKTQRDKDSIRDIATDQTTIKTINVNNLRVQPGAKTQPWSLSNFDVSLAYTQTLNSSPTVAENKVDRYRGAIGYNFQRSSKYIEPFKKLIKSKSKWLQLVKDFNFNPVPSTIGVRADVNRQMGRFIPRVVNTDLTKTSVNRVERVDTTYDKYFTFDRYYTVRWDVSKSLNLDFNAANNARVDEPNGAIDTREKKDSVRSNFLNGGRTTNYTQKSIASYTLPFNKFPLTDWVTARYSYNTFYNWIGASRVAIELGNSIENGQDNTMTAQFDLNKLYNKSRYLRSVLNPLPSGMTNPPINNLLKNLPKKEDVLQGLTGKDREKALARWKKQRKDAKNAMRLQRQNQTVNVGIVGSTIGKVLTMLKTVQVNYTEGYKSRIPGWMDSTQAFGHNFKSMQPGIDYVFGKQPDRVWLDRKAAQGLFTRDSNFNLFYRQDFEQKLNITAQIEPIKELMIDISLEKSFTKNYQEIFKDSLNRTTTFERQHLNPSAMGGFSVSYIALSTLFQSSNPNEVSDLFKKFEGYRSVVSQRLAKENPYFAQQGLVINNGFAEGYDKHHQDVLIPAFLAAYTNKDPNSMALVKHDNGKINTNPFSGIKPMPNWRLSYTGLSKIPALAKTFSSINISHQYSGSLSMNSFTSSLQFSDPLLLGVPRFRNNDTGNFVPFFLVPNLTIQEQLQPLIGIDITTTNQINLRFEYKKSRILSLSLVDYQLSETRSTEWTVGGSFRQRGVRLPKFLMKLISKTGKLDNDLSVKLDLSMRDDATNNSRLDQPNAYGTGGQKVITIQPAIDYVINNRLNIKFFFDQRRIIPYISTAPPTTNTRAGVQLRISLQ
jgi:cell surface protein SprA